MNLRPLSCAVLLCLAACQDRHAPAEAPPLAGARLGGPFSLTDQAGRPVSDRSFAGRYRLIYFGYSYCPDVCPTTLQALMAGYHRLPAEVARRIVPIFITVDPARDTPPVLARYVAAFGPELVGLTGPADRIAPIARAYGVSFHAQPAAPGSTGYLVDHVSQPILYGPDGAPIVLLPADQGPDAVAATLRRWVR
ncbi:SCO family protein [Sphingomonas morindae]|uniref:SCO family protein n=1 Tax=Sphingomonas morindae TaxID=1541170 RepID=A0ABY4XBJ1_9SPHN|nr:SCO family protein [Sphingomonas morindae]USI74250.1 SCO family protein [Sphingomonas morindae]